METWNTADEILDYAMAREEEAAKFYADLAGVMERETMRELFRQFSREEEGHRARLQDVKRRGTFRLSGKRVQDLKLGDYLVNVRPKPDMTFQEALILAMKREKASFKLYTDMSAAVDDTALNELLAGMAQEEAKHKLRFEIEYDDYVFRED